MTSVPASANVVALIALVSIQVSIALLYKFSGHNGSYGFSPASALAMAELTKLVMSCALHIRAAIRRGAEGPILGATTGRFESRSGGTAAVLRGAWRSARSQVTARFLSQAAGLALLYLLNNHLSFHLYLVADPGTISLFKSGCGFVSCVILWTLGRGISANQWACVAQQAIGLALAQYEPSREHARYTPQTYAFLLATVTLSAVSAVWNEHLIKRHGVSVNVQNMCLYAFGFGFNVLAFHARKAAGEDGKGFFEGYGNLLALSVVASNALVGLAITAVYKYADVMVKQIAYVVSTAVLIAFGIACFGERASFSPVAGCLVVFLSTYLYFHSSIPQKKQVVVAGDKHLRFAPSETPSTQRRLLLTNITLRQATTALGLMGALMIVTVGSAGQLPPKDTFVEAPAPPTKH